MKQLKNEDQLPGKVISRVCYPTSSYKVFVFKDKTFIVYQYNLEGEVLVMTSDILRMYPEECHRYNLITKKEMEKIVKTKAEEMKKTRFINYKILKEEFEGNKK
jgi:hypothetical protein